MELDRGGSIKKMDNPTLQPYMIKLSLIILVAWTFFQGIFTEFTGILPKNIDLLDEIILLGLTFFWLGCFINGRIKFKRTPFDTILLLLMIYVPISALINAHSPFVSLLALRDTFQYLLLFYILVQLEIKKEILLHMFKLIFIIAILEFFVVMLQMGINFAKTGNLFLEDLAYGTFGVNGAHKLGYFMGMMIVTSLCLYINNKEKKYLFSTFLFCITLILTSCRGAYLLTGLALVFLYKGYFLKNLKRFAIGFLILIFLGLSIFYYNRISTGNYAMINPKGLFSQQLGLKPGTGRRIGVMVYFADLLKNSDHPFFGFSPGRIGKTSMYFARSEIVEEFESLYEDTDYVLIVNQLTVTFIEYGIIGSLIIFFAFLKIYGINYTIAKKEKNQFLSNFGFIFKGVFLIYLLGIFSEKVFEIQELSFYFWFLFSAIYLLNINNEKDQTV